MLFNAWKNFKEYVNDCMQNNKTYKYDYIQYCKVVVWANCYQESLHKTTFIIPYKHLGILMAMIEKIMAQEFAQAEAVENSAIQTIDLEQDCVDFLTYVKICQKVK